MYKPLITKTSTRLMKQQYLSEYCHHYIFELQIKCFFFVIHTHVFVGGEAQRETVSIHDIHMYSISTFTKTQRYSKKQWQYFYL